MLVFDVFRWRLTPRDSGVVDQDVDAAVAFHDVISDPVDSRALRDVHHGDLGIVPFCAQFVAASLGEAGVLVCDDGAGPGFRQRLDARKADGTGTAGNEGNLPSHPEFLEVHSLPRLSRPLRASTCPRRSSRQGPPLRIETVDAGRIRRDPDRVARLPAELANGP